MQAPYHRSFPAVRSTTVILCVVSVIACGGGTTAPDGRSGSAPPAPAFTVAADTTTLREAQTFGLRLRGARASDSAIVQIAGVTAPTRAISDSVVEVFMPLGSAGPVTLEVRVGRTGTPRTARLTLTRVAAPAVAAPDPFLDSLTTGLTATVTRLEGRPVPGGLSPTAYAADLAIVRQMRDSAARSFARLTPSERAEAARIIAAIAAGPATPPGQLFSVAAPVCRATRGGAVTCLEQTEATLRTDLRALLRATATIGAGALLIPLSGPIGVAVAAWGVASFAETAIGMHERVYQALGSPAILTDLELPLTSGAFFGQTLSSSTGPLILVPDAGQLVSLRLRARNPLPSDANLPIIAALLPPLQEISARWAALNQRLPTAFQLSAPGLLTRITDSIVSPPEPNELRVASVSVAGITAAITPAPGGATLTLRGDPGAAGLDLTVTLAAGSARTGIRTLVLPVRYERAETVRLTAAVLAPRCVPRPDNYNGPTFGADGSVQTTRLCQVRWFGAESLRLHPYGRFSLDPLGGGFSQVVSEGVADRRLGQITLTLARPLPAPLLNVAGLRAYRATSSTNPPPIPTVELSPYSLVAFCRPAGSTEPLPTVWALPGAANATFSGCEPLGIQRNQRSMIIGEQVSGTQVNADFDYESLVNTLPPGFELYVAVLRQVGERDIRSTGGFDGRSWMYRAVPFVTELSNWVRVPLP